MKRYTVERTAERPPLSGELAGTPWADANAAAIDTFPWEGEGEKQGATARVLHDDGALYLQFHVEDTHSYAETTALNGPVYEDSCVEFFASPEPDRRPHYVNVELNCCGTMLVGWGPDRDNRERITPDLAAEITVETSIDGPTKEESPDDDAWWLAAALPFGTLRAFTGVDVSPAGGTVWRGNFYRCGGRTEPRFAVWNPIDAPEPDYHRPECFGELRFA